jgi:hypothetical protein
MSDQEQNASAPRTPPYVAYKTFLTLIDDLATHGLPPVIDRSVLKRFSGGVGSQLLMALKSLHLATEDNKPTGALAKLVESHGKPEFKVIMERVLRTSYPFLHSIDLRSATPGMFADAFKVTGAKEDVLKKCRRFYLAAAMDNGVLLGPRIMGGSVPKAPRANNGSAGSTAPTKRRVKKAENSARTDGAGNTTRQHILADHHQSVQAQLLAKFPTFDPAWPDELKQSWFAGFKDLMAASGTKSGGQ